MSEHPKVVVTLKGGDGFKEPWIVLHADSPAEAADLISQVGGSGLDAAVRAAAKRFQVVSPTGQQTVEAAFPDSTVLSSPSFDGPAREGTFSPPYRDAGPPQDRQQLPQSMSPPCAACGSPTSRRDGVSKKTGKPYTGYFCNASRDHAPKFV